MKQRILLISFVLISISACKTHKLPSGNSGNIGSNDLITIEKAVNENAFEFEYLSFRGAGRFEGLGMQQNISLSFRMQRHEKVWISAQALLGIEVGRALITRDSVFLLQNFPERNYREFSLDSLAKFLSVPLSVTQLQDLFVGNPLLPYDNAEVALQGDSIVVQKAVSEFLLREFFHPSQAKIQRNYLYSRVKEGVADVKYSAFSELGNKQLPTKVNIFVQRPDNELTLDLSYSSISTEKISSFPFRKPAN